MRRNIAQKRDPQAFIVNPLGPRFQFMMGVFQKAIGPIIPISGEGFITGQKHAEGFFCAFEGLRFQMMENLFDITQVFI